MGLSWLQPMYSLPGPGYAQCHDGECITGTSNGNHIGIMIGLYIAIAVHFAKCNLYLYCVMQCIFYQY